MGVILRKYFIIVILLLFTSFSSVYADDVMHGQVNDAIDCEDAGWHVVMFYYQDDEINNITCQVAPYDHRYSCSVEGIPNHTWKIGDIIFARVIDTGDGYVSEEVNITTTGGFDVMPTMQLIKPDITQDPSYPNCADSDNDYITDFSDNCKNIYNYHQEDEDNDNRGDVCDFDINITKGWNLISPYMGDSDSNTDRNINLDLGWNLFGYSNKNPFNWSHALIRKPGYLDKTIEEAALESWIQLTIYYFDNDHYKFIPGHDSYLRNSKGYWLYALEDDLTLVIPSVGGALAENSYYWLNASFDNGTEIKTIQEASSLGWVQSTIYAYDQGYKFIPGDYDYIYPWKGYWLYSNYNLTLVFP